MMLDSLHQLVNLYVLYFLVQPYGMLQVKLRIRVFHHANSKIELTENIEWKGCANRRI